MEEAQNRKFYGKYQIVAKPQQLDSGEWTLDVDLFQHCISGMKSTSYYAKNTYKTKEEAIHNCFLFGKRIIDGDIKF